MIEKKNKWVKIENPHEIIPSKFYKNKRMLVKGTETNTITTFRSFKGLMLDLLRGYPEYEYWGKFESVFAETGNLVVDILSKDKLIELSPKEEGKKYRLTPSGINLAISLINLEYSEEILKYSNKMNQYNKVMRKFTIAIIILSGLTFFLGLLTLYFEYFKPSP